MERLNRKDTKKIYISCLPSQIEDSTILNYFSQFGEVEYMDVKREETEDKRCTGFCQLSCSSIEMRDDIMNMTHKLQGKVLKITKFYEGEELDRYRKIIKTQRIYVKNLPLDTKDEELRDVFEPYGEIIEAYCVKKKRYPNKKFGYVLFEKEDTIKKIPNEDIQFKDRIISWYQTNKSLKKSKQETPERKEKMEVNIISQRNPMQEQNQQVIQNRNQHYRNEGYIRPSSHPDRHWKDTNEELILQRLKYFTPPEEARHYNIDEYPNYFEFKIKLKRLLNMKYNSLETLIKINRNHRLSNIRLNWNQDNNRNKDNLLSSLGNPFPTIYSIRKSKV